MASSPSSTSAINAAASAAASSPSAITPEELATARVLLGMEAAMHLVSLPIAVISLVLLARSSILHFNLKFILLCQTGAILLRSSLRLPAIGVKFALENPFWPETAFPPLQFGLLVAVFFRNFLGHVILAERALATWKVRNYEWDRRFRWFSPGWFFPLLLLAIWNGFSTKIAGTEQNGSCFFPLTSVINLITGSGTLFFNFFELIIISLLFLYNRKQFLLTHKQQNVHNLSERYQLLENVRTTRQLLPILGLHFLSNFNNSALQIGQLFKLFAAWPTVQFLFDTNALGFFNASILTLALLVATIVCHPMLRRNAAMGLLRARNSCLGRKGSIAPSTTSLWLKSPVEQLKRKEEYFKVLDKFWDQEFHHRQRTI